MYMMEVDRVLRPGGYWILSGPPINWKTYYKTWKRSEDELQKEQRRIEELADLLCWEKQYEKGDVAIWKKSINDYSCKRKNDSSVGMCKDEGVDGLWYNSIFFKLLLLFSIVKVLQRSCWSLDINFQR